MATTGKDSERAVGTVVPTPRSVAIRIGGDEIPVTENIGLGRRHLLVRAGKIAAGLSTLTGIVSCASRPPPVAASAPHPLPGNTLGLGVVGLPVRDLRRSLDFYRRLGLPIPDHVADDNYRLTLPNGQTFFWDTDTVMPTFDPNWRRSAGSRRVVLEFGFATPHEVDAKHDEMVAAGHPSYLRPQDLFGTRYAMLIDPDGNEISLRFPLTGYPPPR